MENIFLFIFEFLCVSNVTLNLSYNISPGYRFTKAVCVIFSVWIIVFCVTEWNQFHIHNDFNCSFLYISRLNNDVSVTSL